MPQPPSPASDAPTPARILIVRLSAHGDVMHTLPLLNALRQAYPQAKIGWLTETSAAPLLENHPQLDCLHVVHRKRWLKALGNPLRWPSVRQEVQALLQELQAQDYCISLDVQGLLKSAIWPFWAGVPQRYGFARTREQAALFYTHKLSPMNIRDAHTPAIERYLDFARVLGATVGEPGFVVPPVSSVAEDRVNGWLETLKPAGPVVVLAPFTRWPSKHWPMSAWPALMEGLLNLDLNLVIIGAASDAERVEGMLASVPKAHQRDRLLNLAGKTDWPDLYALFARTRYVIGLDSAPLHMANAVGTPHLVGLYGPTAPGRTGPVGRRQTVLTTQLSCQPCFERDCPLKTHDCMRQLTPARVLETIRGLMQQETPVISR